VSSRDTRLVLLAVTTGVTDATAFERLGHTFRERHHRQSRAAGR
jgi:uncharacterized membrane protein YoaK (UPF0700 family)